jgi:hypothetical protein
MQGGAVDFNAPQHGKPIPQQGRFAVIVDVHVRGGIEYHAGFGEGGTASKYRYTLSRYWAKLEPSLFACAEDRTAQLAVFIMLNPSTADATQDDPTVAKCMRLARRWGFGGLEVRNIFAWRATDPNELKVCLAKGGDPTGGNMNDVAILNAVNDSRTGLVIAAWGNNGYIKDRATHVRALLKATGRIVYAFKISQNGEPEHPLYQPEGISPENGMVRYL